MVSKMKTKIFAISILMILALGNIVVFVAASEENQAAWPTSWILADTDQNEAGSSNDYRDVHLAYYYYDNDYLYFRLECFGSPNFVVEPESRYKWFIDTDDPYNMKWQGGNVYDAEFLLFVEDSPKPGGDGSGDVYLLHDVDGDGFIGDDWPDYSSLPGPILNNSVAGYRIVDNCIDVYVNQVDIGNPIYSYFTWSTDQEDPNLDSTSTADRSDSYWDENLSKSDLSIVISDNTDPVYPGDYLTYTLQVTNHGPHTAVNVSIKDILPDTVSFIDAIPAQNGINGLTLWWNFTSLAVGDSELIIINVTINNDTESGVIMNFAVVFSGTHDPMSGNNAAWAVTTVYLDTDSDGIPDCDDPDDDNDGWSDTDEIVYGTDPLDPDDYPVDTDGDGIPDCDDPDDDNDGWSDTDEVSNETDPLDPSSFPDSIPPSNITGLTVTDAKDGKLDLSWDAATDNIGVDHYEIYRDGILLLNITGTSYQDTGLVNGQSYNYTVRAVDGAGNKGNFSNPVYGTPTKTSTPYTPPTYNPVEDENNTPIENDSEEVSLGIGYETITVNDSYSALSQPTITGPSEGYTDIVYNFSIISNDLGIDIKFIIDWGDSTINESDYLAAGSELMIHHKWIQPGQYTITVTASDGQSNATIDKSIKINTPNTAGTNNAEAGNVLFILLALLALMFLPLYLLLGKRRKDEDKK